jgi:hypothetical protein
LSREFSTHTIAIVVGDKKSARSSTKTYPSKGIEEESGREEKEVASPSLSHKKGTQPLYNPS